MTISKTTSRTIHSIHLQTPPSPKFLKLVDRKIFQNLSTLGKKKLSRFFPRNKWHQGNPYPSLPQGSPRPKVQVVGR